MRVDEYPISTLIDKISKVVNEVQPNIIYLPFKGDVHSDHRKVFEASYSCTKSFRYPFIKKIIVNENQINQTGYIINVDIYMNLNDFLEFYGVFLTQGIETMYRINIDNDFLDTISVKYLSSILSNQDENSDKFGYMYNNEIEDSLNDYIDFLPEKMIHKYNSTSTWDQREITYNSKILLEEYIIDFDPIRYINYSNNYNSENNN
jgi:hypothetical protein